MGHPAESSNNSLLRLAWEKYVTYDKNSIDERIRFRRMQLWVLVLGVLVTLLSLSQVQLRILGINTPQLNSLQLAIVILPIAMSILAAGSSRFRPGNKYLWLRNAAELTKQEIYLYRIQGIDQSSRDEKLADRLETINNTLMEEFRSANLYFVLRPYVGEVPPKMYGYSGSDDGLKDLTADEYISIRLGDRLAYYRALSIRRDSALKILQWLIYVIGGTSSFLAAVGFQLWIPLTTSIVAAITAYLSYTHIEGELMKLNHTQVGLENVRLWWTALSSMEKMQGKNIDTLVKSTESILSEHVAGLAQEVENVLDRMYQKQQKLGERVEAKQEDSRSNH